MESAKRKAESSNAGAVESKEPVADTGVGNKEATDVVATKKQKLDEAGDSVATATTAEESNGSATPSPSDDAGTNEAPADDAGTDVASREDADNGVASKDDSSNGAVAGEDATNGVSSDAAAHGAVAAGDDPTKWPTDTLVAKLKEQALSLDAGALVEGFVQLVQEIEHLENRHFTEMLKKCPEVVAQTVLTQCTEYAVEELEAEEDEAEDGGGGAEIERLERVAPSFTTIDDLANADIDALRETFNDAVSANLRARADPITDDIIALAQIGEFPLQFYQRLTWTGPYADSFALGDGEEDDEEMDDGEDDEEFDPEEEEELLEDDGEEDDLDEE